MAAIHNQKGYTLILVMVIISVIMILGVALSGVTLNANKQINMTDRQNKATDLAEMGITHFEETINGLISQAENQARHDILDLSVLQTIPALDTIYTNVNANFSSSFCEKFRTLYQQNIYNQNETDHSIPVDVESGEQYVIQPDPFGTCSNSSVIKVTFNSVGKTAGAEKPVTLRVTFNIQQLPYKDIPQAITGNYNTLNNNGMDIITNPITKLKNLLNRTGSLLVSVLGLDIDSILKSKQQAQVDLTEYLNLPSILKITANGDSVLSITDNTALPDLVLNGSSTLSALFINGNLKFNALTANGNPPTGLKLLTSGNVYIPENAILHGNSFNLCVLGDIYLFDDQNNLRPLPVGTDNNELNNTTIVNRCNQGHWGISSNGGIEVNYNY